LRAYCTGRKLTATFIEAVELELLHPYAVTLTVAIPENKLFHVTTPELDILPGPIDSLELMDHA
jgi:hypothetical protein